ncbi:MAG: CvpA family protein [Oscillospiraceae bacterium]|jgi:uncharacterized membrane protein required for colicin V production|nr:CvpA family protein [Oscillospiraceae bacterium]
MVNASMLPWLLDGALVLIFALTVLFALKRGFLSVVLSLACWLVSLVFAGALSAAVAQPAYDALAAQPVRNMIETRIADTAVGTEAAVLHVEKLLEELPDSLRELADFSGVSLDALVNKLEAMPTDGRSAAELLESTIVAPVAVAAIRWGLSIAFFALLLLLTRLIARQLERAGKIPVIKQANQALGAVLGVAKGLLVVFVLCLLLRVAAELRADGDFAAAVEEAKIPKLLGLLPVRKGL